MKLTKAKLQKIIKEEIDGITQSGPFPSLESMETLDRSDGREMPKDVVAWIESTPGFKEKLTDVARSEGMRPAMDMILDIYDNDPRAEKRTYSGHAQRPASTKLTNAVLDMQKLGLTDEEVVRILRQVADEIEDGILRAGY
jgi:hypothetical protein